MSRNVWLRVTRQRRCPICNRPDWCLVSVDGNTAICARIASPRRAGEAGWLHRLGEADQHDGPTRAAISCKEIGGQDLSALAARYTAACDRRRIAILAQGLGISEPSLRRLALGWDGQAYTFPMRDEVGHVIGIRRRLPNGRKLSVKGGREGLFVPVGLPGASVLLICEGPTDTAAMLDLGYAAIGRPSCSGGTRLVCPLVKGRDVIVVADADEPGRRGAATLAILLRLYCSDVRMIAPPDGVKDARAWLNAGATSADVRQAIQAAESLKLSILANERPSRGRSFKGLINGTLQYRT